MAEKTDSESDSKEEEIDENEESKGEDSEEIDTEPEESDEEEEESAQLWLERISTKVASNSNGVLCISNPLIYWRN